MTIAVTGATGQLGRLVIQELKARVPAADIVALARSPERAAALGVPAREADYERPETLASALSGVRTLLLISSSEVGRRAAQHRAVIEAARRAGVGRIVYTSLLHADRSPLSLAEEHRDTEAAIRAAGLSYTILRNGWYAENHTGAIGGALAGGALIGSAGEGRISWAARADYAAAAAVVIAGEGFENQVLELAGDEAHTLAELAAEVSRQSGREIPYRDLSERDYAAALAGFGLPPALADAIAGWDALAARGALEESGGTLKRLIGRPTTPLSHSVAQALR